MIITKIDFRERRGKDVYWQIKNVNLSMFNLIIGLNSTGKTRLVNTIANFAKTLSGKIPYLKDGKWNIKFQNPGGNTVYQYNLEVEDNVVLFEEMIKDKDVLLKRQKEDGEILSKIHDKMIGFSPPKNQLTPHVRRDIKEFPFLEELLNWAENFYGYMFTNATPKQVAIPSSSGFVLENLGTIPYILANALKNREIRDSIINDFTAIGYPVENLDVIAGKTNGLPGDRPISVVKEKGLSYATEQDDMSQGMFRALSVVVILEYLIRLDKECTVVIDDLGEGLDYERSNAVTALIQEKLKRSKIQFIATSNDRYLINAVNIESLNLLERNGHVVSAYNYANSKEAFDEFGITGLNNFDFFMGRMYKDEE
jgi:energy-coupling factor transporter ATP-binding protein EcfA2